MTRPAKFRPRPGIRCHHLLLPIDEVDEVMGIPATSVHRTLLDLAAVLAPQRLERALNEADVRGLTDRLSLPELIARYPGRRGVAKLRAVLETRRPGGVTRSPLEERFVAFLDAHRLPRPELNATLALRSRFFEVDCLWRREQLAAELDGRAFHDTDRAFEHDRRRDRVLQAEGWRTTRITWRQLSEEPEAVAADLRRLLRASAVAPTLQ